MKSRQNIAIIHNPNAGINSDGKLKFLLDSIPSSDADITIYKTDYKGHATIIGKELVESGDFAKIFISGGDGTIREVAEGVYGSSQLLGIIPVGTANVLAKELGYMRGSKFSVSQIRKQFVSDQCTDFYPYHILCHEERKLGLCWVGVGFDAAVLNKVNGKLKKRIGKLAFILPILRALSSDNFMVPIHNEKQNLHEMRGGWVLYANINHYAGSFKLRRDAIPFSKGGVCFTLKGTGFWNRLLDQIFLASGRFSSRAEAADINDGILKIGNIDSPVQLDGDFIGYGPVSIDVDAKAIRFATI